MKEKEKAELPPPFFEKTPWSEESDPIWPASLFILQRNLARFNFPPKLETAQANESLEYLRNSLLSSSELDTPLFLKAENVSPIDKEFLFEHYLCLQGFQNTAKGQGFVVDKEAKFLALLNIQDHLQLHLLDSKGGWESCWNQLTKIERSLMEKLDFAFNPRFGHLTSDPTTCGTALTVLVYLHLPALIHTGQFQEVFIKQKEEEVEAISMQGDLSDIVGDLVVLRNIFTVGLSEENILRALQTMSMRLITLEKTVRSQIKSKDNPELKDEVSRAVGLLLHSYQLQTKEALDAISLLKLGLDLGWVSGITSSKLNEIFFKCRHAHLSHAFHLNSLDPHEASHPRAEFLHQQLSSVTLTT